MGENLAAKSLDELESKQSGDALCPRMPCEFLRIHGLLWRKEDEEFIAIQPAGHPTPAGANPKTGTSNGKSTKDDVNSLLQQLKSFLKARPPIFTECVVDYLENDSEYY